MEWMMSNERLKKELLKKRSWNVSEAIEFVRKNKGDENAELFTKAYKQYTQDPIDSFYRSDVLVMFVDDLDDEE